MYIEPILRPVALPLNLIGHAAPCDFFDAKGTLLLRAGSPILVSPELARQPSRFFCEASQADRISTVNPIDQLCEAGKTLSSLIEKTTNCQYVSSSDFIDLAHHVCNLWTLDADACIGYARLVQFDRPSICHAILTSLFAAELAAASSLPHHSIVEIIGSALTMNLASLALHEEMFLRTDKPNEEKRNEIYVHPMAGVKLMEWIGGFSRSWLDTVGQHHENLDGSGYPNGLKRTEISLQARMLRIADTLTARLTGRKKRPPRRWSLYEARNPRHLIEHIFGSDIERLDQTLVRLLMARLGAFPPGTLVRLSNGDLAVVSRRQSESDARSLPREVWACIDKYGQLLKPPRLRQIGAYSFKIRSYFNDEITRLPLYDWRLAWGYGY